jgi:hypothetical protein
MKGRDLLRGGGSSFGGWRLVIITGAKRTRKKTAGQKQADQIIATARAPVEHGFAVVKNWRVLTRLRLNPARATKPAANPAGSHEPRVQPMTDDQ